MKASGVTARSVHLCEYVSLFVIENGAFGRGKAERGSADKSPQQHTRENEQNASSGAYHDLHPDLS